MPQAASTSHDSTHDSSTPDHHDDLIVVPKGKSKLQFMLTLGLLLFVLLIFSVGDSLQNAMGGLFGGEDTNPIYLSWTDPTTQVKHEVEYEDFRRRFTGLDTLHSIGVFQPRHVPEGKKRPRVTPEDVGLVLVLDQMASDAGIEVSDGEFQQSLLGLFQTAANVTATARQRRLTVPALERLLRDQMRVEKLMIYLNIGATAGADAEKVEALWKEQHPQFAFQYAEVEGAQYMDQALASVPADEELQEWFHAQPLFEQQRHFTEESFRGLVAYASLDEPFDATALLERFPAPEGLDPDVQARSYYNRFNNVRFKNEVPDEEQPAPSGDNSESEAGTDAEATGDDEASDGDLPAPAPAPQESEEVAVETGAESRGEEAGEGAQDEDNSVPSDDVADDESETDEIQETPLYKPFEDVSEQCLREAPLHAALTAWYADLRMRMSAAPEEAPLDFATEAEAVGLTVVRIEDALTKVQLEEQEGWGGKFLSNQFTYALEGDLLSSVILEEGAIVAGKLTEKVARQEPPMDQIREAVGEDWAKERAVNMAVEALEAVRDGLGERPAESTDDSVPDEPDETPALVDVDEDPGPWLPTADKALFETLLADAGFQMVDRPWLEQFEVPDDDYDAMSAADKAIRVSVDLFDLEPGQVAGAMANAENTHALLVRFSGKRDRPLADMKAADLMRLRQQVSGEASNSLGESLFRFDSDWFKDRFQVDFEPWNQAEEDAAGEGATDGDADADSQE